jgi:hypothetical protein
VQNDLKEINVPSPAIDEDKLLNDIKYAEEISHMLHEEFEENTFASGIREAILHFARIVPFIFDGTRSVMGTKLADLRGYDRAVKMRINYIKRETLMLAKSGKTLLGGNIVSLFQLFRVIGLPLFITYTKNKPTKDGYGE